VTVVLPARRLRLDQLEAVVMGARWDTPLPPEETREEGGALSGARVQT